MPRYFQQDPEPEQQPYDEDFAPEEEDIPVELPYDNLYDQPALDDVYELEDDVLEDDELLTEEEQAALRRTRWRVLANLSDFIGVIAGTAVILLLIALIISLVHWVRSDITQSFTLWQTRM